MGRTTEATMLHAAIASFRVAVRSNSAVSARVRVRSVLPVNACEHAGAAGCLACPERAAHRRFPPTRYESAPPPDTEHSDGSVDRPRENAAPCR